MEDLRTRLAGEEAKREPGGDLPASGDRAGGDEDPDLIEDGRGTGVEPVPDAADAVAAAAAAAAALTLALADDLAAAAAFFSK